MTTYEHILVLRDLPTRFDLQIGCFAHKSFFRLLMTRTKRNRRRPCQQRVAGGLSGQEPDSTLIALLLDSPRTRAHFCGCRHRSTKKVQSWLRLSSRDPWS